MEGKGKIGGKRKVGEEERGEERIARGAGLRRKVGNREEGEGSREERIGRRKREK